MADTIQLEDGNKLVKNPDGKWVEVENLPRLPLHSKKEGRHPESTEVVEETEEITSTVPLSEYKPEHGGVPVIVEEKITEVKEEIPEGYAVGRRATPFGVLGQFSKGYVESLMAFPDYIIEQVAQGVSDTFDLGWNDKDIFQFVDALNKSKIGYMGGNMYIWEDPEQKASRLGLTLEEVENIDMPQNEWEKWARTTGHVTGFGQSIFMPSSIAAVRGWPNMRTLKPIRHKDGSTTYEWVVDPTKIKGKFEGSKAAMQEYMNWIANNPLKAAQLDLAFSMGAGSGLYGVQRNLTDEFKENHPVLTSVAEMGGILVGGFPAPVIAITAGKLGHIMLTKGPGGLAIKYSGKLVSQLLSLRTKTQQQQFMRKVEATVDKRIIKELRDVFHLARQDPASVIPRETAMLIKSNVVHGDAINALKQDLRSQGMEEDEIMNTLWALAATQSKDNAEPVIIAGKEFDVGLLGKEALTAYEKLLRDQGLDENKILEALSNAQLKLSMAELAPSATLVQSQLAMENRVSGERLALIINRKQSNMKKVASFYEAMFPTDKDAPTYVINHLTGEIQIVNQFKKEIEAAGTTLEGLAGETLPIITQADKIATGANLRKTLFELLEDAKVPYRETSEIIQTVGKGSLIRNFQKLKDSILEGIWGVSKAETAYEQEVLKTKENLPDVVKNMLNFEGTPSIYDLWKTYMQLSDQLFEAQISKSTGIGGAKADWAHLSLVQKKLFDFLQNEAIAIPGSGGLKLSQFFKNYKTDVGDIFYKNAAYNIGRKKVGSGDYYTNDEMVANEFLKSADDANSLAVVYQNIADPGEKAQLLESVESVLLDKIANAPGVLKNGKIDTKNLLKWIDKNNAILENFPKIKSKLSNAITLGDKLANRIKTLKQRVETVETEFVKEKLRPIIDIVNKDISVDIAKVPEAIRGEVKENLIYNVNDLIKKALKDPNLMRVLAQRMTATAGKPITGYGENVPLNMFRKLVWQNIGDKIDLTNPKQVLTWMNGPEGKRALEIILSNNQIDKIKKTVQAYDVIMLTSPDPQGAAMSKLPWMENIEQMTGSSPRTMTSVMRAWREGRISGQNTLIYLFSRAVSAMQYKKFQDLYFEGFSNPDVAEQLAKDIAPLHMNTVNYFTSLPPFRANFIRKWLMNNGIKLPDGVFTEEPIIIDTPVERVNPNKTPDDQKFSIDPPSGIRKNPRVKGDQTSSLAPMKMNIPDVVPGSRLEGSQEDLNIAMAQTPTGQIAEEDYASFFPHDTTGQMIAARRAAEGGIMSVNKHQRQRVL